MHFRAWVVALGVLCAVGIADVGSAQTINIDFGDDAGTPSSTYAAAGVAGEWNSINDVSLPAVLTDVAGNLTAATMTVSPVDAFLDATNDQSTMGDEGALLRDFLRAGTGDMLTISFANLLPGEYRVLTYAVGPQTSPSMSWVWTNGMLGDNVVDLFGTTSNGLEMEMTHAEHFVTVDASGGLSVTIKGEGTSFVNGIQLIPVPLPGMVSMIGLAGVGAGCFGLRNGRRRT
ncbi:MAG: hypothetical protein KC983_10480 [Phycisphaerales bacterium]|nr:hypothetical protein [Phycisphaerales bacterium]